MSTTTTPVLTRQDLATLRRCSGNTTTATRPSHSKESCSTLRPPSGVSDVILSPDDVRLRVGR